VRHGNPVMIGDVPAAAAASEMLLTVAGKPLALAVSERGLIRPFRVLDLT
jgi:hypothetical protein